ncbi:pitrilysin family protein [Neolewinella lacunae]|uniref:Insulinase family protein n=1 Tax=Neolewinella lacunae TaxID=1517758 RepID=A0A923PI95_9BACT|nr:pitrilysin family protein [Neolewinella lacunae]MBC6994575.1 insulinase family protein [Neolewinella lacunae]MDN3633924.1 pitrilysin family protein [Neolewinella lacunae]
MPARRWQLSNGLPVVAVTGVEQPVLKVELIVDAGRPFEPRKLISALTDDLLTEGTRHRSAAEVEAFFEHFGTSLRQPDLMDTNNLSLSTIHRRAAEVLPVMAEVAISPSFSVEGFERMLRRRKQNLRENLADNDTLAYRLITEAIFGSHHPYGYNSYLDSFEGIGPEDLVAFHRQTYHAGNATLFVAGNVTPAIEKLLDETFGQMPSGGSVPAPTLLAKPTQPRLLQLSRPRAQQSMIRRGRSGIQITNPDYPGLVVLDTVFGGYFGSRLMRNIREEKGFTYGIESDLEVYRFDGTFGVSADVANESLVEVRREIDLEVEKLLQDPVPAPELDMVRAYLSGNIAMGLDGVLGHAYRYRAALIKDYDANDYLQRLEDTVLHITPAELQDLAQRYLCPGQDSEVIVGGAPPVDGVEMVLDVERPLDV